MSTSSKADKAAREASHHEAEANAAPPSYEAHVHDEVFSNKDAREMHESHSSSIGLPLEDVAFEDPLLPQSTPSNEPLSLTLDNDLVYPTLPPSNALYHIPRLLQWSGDRVYLERSVPQGLRKDGSPKPTKDQQLYEICAGFSKMSSIELRAKRAGCHGIGTALMKRTSQFHQHWEVHCQKELVLRYKNYKWTDAQERVLAVEEPYNRPRKEEEYRVQRVMVIQLGVNQKMMNLLVACWTTRVWREIQVEMSKESNKDNLKTVFRTGCKFPVQKIYLFVI